MNANKRDPKVPIMAFLVLGFVFTGIASCNENNGVYTEPVCIIVFSDDFESHDVETCQGTTWATIDDDIFAEISSRQYVRPIQLLELSAYYNRIRSSHVHIGYIDRPSCDTSVYSTHKAATDGLSVSREGEVEEQLDETMKKYFTSVLTFLAIGMCTYFVFKGKPKRPDKEVDTFWVTLLGLSLILMIFSTFLIWYFLFRSIGDYQEFLLHDQGFIPEMPRMDIYLVESVGPVAVLIFILPLIASFIVWYVMPSFVKHWYSLEPLPSKYRYVYDLVQKIASQMGISPPAILYTQKSCANCFNLGKREGESTLVISNWVVTHLEPDELEAVLTHEMAHTKNRDVTLMAYFAVVRRIIFLFPIFVLFLFFYTFLQSGYPNFPAVLSPTFWGPLVVFFTIYSLLGLGIQWFSRLREATADARASLFVDKNVLKRVIYKFASARSMGMPFVSSCLMMSDNRRFGSIFSTHPPIYKRYEMLDQKKHIIDYRKLPSLKSCFITALSIYVFLQLVNYIFSALVLSVTGALPQSIILYFFNPIIVAALLILHYDYLPRKYLGVLILLIASLQFIVFMVFGIPSFLFAKYVLLPTAESIPSGMENTMSYVVDLVENFSETIKMFLLIDILSFSIITFLTTVLLKYARKAYKKGNVDTLK